MIAVFERLDLATLQTTLASAAADPSLELVRFRLQPALKAGTVPDAEISAAFRYLFEVKTAFNAVSLKQLRGHLSHLRGAPGLDERLFVVTPDAAIPAAVVSVQTETDRVSWFSFADLNSAIDSVRRAEGVRDDELLLLRELQALLVEEGLLGRQDTVVVAARLAHSFYLSTGAYVCQRGRAFREGLTHLGFYRKRQIEPEVPRILTVEDNVEFTKTEAARRRALEAPLERRMADLIDQAIASGSRDEGAIHKVFLLSEVNSGETMKLSKPLIHEADGAGSAFTMGQRYVYVDDLRAAETTADLR